MRTSLPATPFPAGITPGVFMGEDAFMNDIFDNTFMDCTDWAMESLGEKYNSTLNNMANMPTRGIELSNGQG